MAQKLSLRQLAWRTVTDTGVALGIVDILLFAGTNPVGLGICLAATTVAAATRITALTQPAFLQKHPKIAKIVSDTRTPLRILGSAMALLTGAALATKGILPATASLMFTITNFKVANSISRAMKRAESGLPEKDEDDKSRPMYKRVLSLAVKRPDIYAGIGSMASGLMAGGAALWMLPITSLSLGMGLYNILNERPEHKGHPKTIFASEQLFYMTVGLLNGRPLISAAHMLNAVAIQGVENKLTPGGFKQVLRDIRDGARSAFQKARSAITGKHPAPAQEPGQGSTPETEAPQSVFFAPSGPDLSDAFKSPKPRYCPPPAPGAACANGQCRI